jgi:hypothetical protein
MAIAAPGAEGTVVLRIGGIGVVRNEAVCRYLSKLTHCFAIQSVAAARRSKSVAFVYVEP